MKIPRIGQLLEDEGGRLYRVLGVHLDDGIRDDKPEQLVLYIDVVPVEARPSIPEGIRRSLES